MIEYEFNPLDDDHRAQEMEQEATEALTDECESCLQPRPIHADGMCHPCWELDRSIGGSLSALITS